jgi:hypothetical protein
MNVIVDPWATYISNLSGGRDHYETLTIEMLVLKNSNAHLLGLSGLFGTLCLFVYVVLKRSRYL